MKNRDYAFIGDKAIITYENGVKGFSKYYDNLDKVLVQENLIDEMENKVKEIVKKRDKKEEYIKKQKKFVFVPIIIGAIMSFAFIPFLFNSTLDENSLRLIFGNMNITKLVSTISLSFFACGSFFEYENYKKSKKEKLGLEHEIDYLEKALEEEKEVLVELKSDKSIKEEKTKELQSVEVNDKEKLQILRNYLSMYYDIGYNEDKYYRYYQNGTLEEKLRDSYCHEEIQKIEEQLIERKGPVLSKKLGSRESE